MKEHMKEAYELCLQETSADPIAILNKLMDLPFCRMHGPEHHVLVGAALLTAYRNAGGELSLPDALAELYKPYPVPPAATGEPAVPESAPDNTCPSSPAPIPWQVKYGASAWP